MRLVRTLGVLGLAVGVAPAANAVPLDGTPSVICLVSGGLNSCASVTVTLSGSVLTATVENVSSGADHYIMPSFGFFFTGSSTATALSLDPTTQTSNTLTWVNGLCEGLEQPGPTGGTFLGGACADTPGDKLGDGDSITLNFAITGSLSSTDDNIFFAFRGQEWAGGSFKCYEGAGGSTPEGAECTPGEPPTTVPEPATMALLATGLVGLGGASAIRRRRQKNS